MPRARLGTLASALLRPALLLLSACPNMELAQLNPCTVSSASLRVDTGGVSDVDLLFVIDNSGSMASEQQKLADQLPQLVDVLVTGDRYAGRTPPAGITDKDRYFTPVKSLHLGVVSSSMGGRDTPNTNPGLDDCNGLGDDGRLLNSTEVAVNGVYQMRGESFGPEYMVGSEIVAPLPGCDEVGDQPPYQTYVASGDLSAEQLAQNFTCVSRLGVRGCPFEQQLEAMWKAVAQSNGSDPALYTFLDGTRGHGDPSGINRGFVRENAILAVIQVSDEEDCSITEGGKGLIADGAEAATKYGPINVRCGAFADQKGLLWPTERYVRGLRSLKPNNPDLIVFAAIVGIPIDAANQDIDDILARDELQFGFPANDQNAVPFTSCISSQGDKAYPPRRFLEVAKGFGDDAIIHSICDDSYSPALEKLIDRIASKLSGNCLPQPLVPDADGLVRCDVFEMLARDEHACDPTRGHDDTPQPRVVVENGKPEQRTVCHMKQVPVLNRQPKAGVVGWYYDYFSADLADECPGQPQRISFSFGDLPSGGGAFIECFRPVPRIEANALGADAVNIGCGDDPELCEQRSNREFTLFCSPDNTCQIACENNPQCPPGWVCGTKAGSLEGPTYCQIPTCPVDDAPSVN
ncbi:MAG TPA: hypothetical protein VI299_23095 [Polyangiales bacterium]